MLLHDSRFVNYIPRYSHIKSFGCKDHSVREINNTYLNKGNTDLTVASSVFVYKDLDVNLTH
jgi:hypothetical protein